MQECRPSAISAGWGSGTAADVDYAMGNLSSAKYNKSGTDLEINSTTGLFDGLETMDSMVSD